MRKVAVTGSRDFKDWTYVWKVLEAEYRIEPFFLLVGDATGVDTFAREWAEATGVRFERFDADWSTHGKAAGPIRNSIMLLEADKLLAFRGGRGTNSAKSIAKRRKIPVEEHHEH